MRCCYDKTRIMKKLKFSIVLLIVLGKSVLGQDPQFSQFFSSPLNINPALTAHINSDWRLISNIRDQWIGPASPYVTGTVSYETKLFQNKIPNVDNSDDNVFGIGAMVLYDHAMARVQRSTYGSLNLSYNMKIADAGGSHRIGIGFGTTYGTRYIDFSRLYFQEQWIGYNGFNNNLPTGEAALSQMKNYFSVSTGLLYNFYTDKTNIDMGVSLYHLNGPKQTFLEDDNQIVPSRKVAHANFETFLNETLVLSTNAVYQFQKEANYFSVGAALGTYVGDQQNILLNAGLWYWSNNAIIPYIGLAYNNFQFGATFDITASKLNQAAQKPKTFEVSLILKGTKKPGNIIPCPWK